jgi:hypothetical protein
MSNEIGLAESGIIREASVTGEAPTFSADFDHLLLCERPFECRRHLIQNLESDMLIINYCTYVL